MKHLATLGLSASLVLLAGLPAAAHHNGATYFDTSTTIEHSGATVVEYAIVNPHGRLHYTFTDADGNVQEWSAELASANNLRRRGLGGEIFKPGDQLVSGDRQSEPQRGELHAPGECRVCRRDRG